MFKNLKLMQIFSKWNNFLIVIKCESKNYLYIYNIKLIEENTQLKNITSKQVFVLLVLKNHFY